MPYLNPKELIKTVSAFGESFSFLKTEALSSFTVRSVESKMISASRRTLSNIFLSFEMPSSVERSPPRGCMRLVVSKRRNKTVSDASKKRSWTSTIVLSKVLMTVSSSRSNSSPRISTTAATPFFTAEVCRCSTCNNSGKREGGRLSTE